jgi:hypothetical protein
MNNDQFPKLPEGGKGRIRQLLESIKEDQQKLNSHPLYKEGWDDGYFAAQENYRRLTNALAKVYNIEMDS